MESQHCEEAFVKNSYSNIIQITPACTSNKHLGLLSFNNNVHNCSLGKTGITALKAEGDGATPIGNFKILYGFYRSDRIQLPATLIPMIPITKTMGWCDDAQNASYNQLVTLPNRFSHEKLMRDDRLYDVCLVLDYNIPRNISYLGRNKGSAIFLHITRKQNAPTQGCIAVEPKLMMRLLPSLSSNTIIKI